MKIQTEKLLVDGMEVNHIVKVFLCNFNLRNKINRLPNFLQKLLDVSNYPSLTMEQSTFPLVHMESPWVGELQPPTPATLGMDLLDKQPGLVWSLMEELQETGVEVNQLVKVIL